MPGVADRRWRRRHSEAVYGLSAYVARRSDGRAPTRSSSAWRKAWPRWPLRHPLRPGRSAPSSPGPARGRCGMPGETRWPVRSPRPVQRSASSVSSIRRGGRGCCFTPHLLAQGGADQGWLPAPAERAQIAYGADATLQNLLRTADASGLTASGSWPPSRPRGISAITARRARCTTPRRGDVRWPRGGRPHQPQQRRREHDPRPAVDAGARRATRRRRCRYVPQRPGRAGELEARRGRGGDAQGQRDGRHAGERMDRREPMERRQVRRAWPWGPGDRIGDAARGGPVPAPAGLRPPGGAAALDRDASSRRQACRSASSGRAVQEPRASRRLAATSISGTWAQTAYSTPDRSRSSRHTSATALRFGSMRCWSSPRSSGCCSRAMAAGRASFAAGRPATPRNVDAGPAADGIRVRRQRPARRDGARHRQLHGAGRAVWVHIRRLETEALSSAACVADDGARDSPVFGRRRPPPAAGRHRCQLLSFERGARSGSTRRPGVHGLAWTCCHPRTPWSSGPPTRRSP